MSERRQGASGARLLPVGALLASVDVLLAWFVARCFRCVPPAWRGFSCLGSTARRRRRSAQ